MKVAIYLRKSRADDQTEDMDVTLTRHKDSLLKFAKNNNLIITEIYEEVVSGDSLFVRPEMVRLLSDIEAHKYDGVLCMDIDRLGRGNMKDSGIILETFKENNTRIFTPRKVYDLNNDIDEFSTEMQTFIARQELKNTTRRLRQGMRKSIEEGYHVCEPPYGYKRTYIGKRPTLEIDEKEAKVVTMIFDMYVNQRIGSHIIAETINSLGYKTRKNTKFSRNTVRFFLQNPTYIGKIVWNKRKTIKKKCVDDKHRTILNPKAEWLVADGIHPKIIDEAIFNKAQQIRSTRSLPPAYKGELKNPFAGLIFCQNCGFSIKRQTVKNDERLMCDTVACSRSVKFKFVEQAILDTISDYISSYKYLAEGKEDNKKSSEIISLSSTIDDIKKQLTLLYSQKENLHDFLEQGIYTIDTFIERNKIISEKIDIAENSLKDYEIRLQTLQSKPTRQSLIPDMEDLLSRYDDLSIIEKNMIFKQVIKRIEYNKTKSMWGNEFKIKVDFNY